MAETVETAIYKMRVEGTQELDRLKDSLTGLVTVEERADRATKTTSDALQGRLARLDPIIRAQQNYAKELQIAKRYQEENTGSEDERAAHVAVATQRYNTQVVAIERASRATQESTRTLGLNRYELLNLSRQMQDVGVSLMGGQSPFVVLTQQGSQILDVFQATEGTLGGFFTQAIGWTGRFIASTAGVTAGLAAIGGVAIYAAASWSSGQRDIEHAISGIGAASGMTRDEINKIGATSASAFGLSSSEARKAATVFAGTGKIYEENTKEATLITKDFARAMGISTTEAAKDLATALKDPIAGALKLNESMGFLDKTTIDSIRSFESMGMRQEAQKVLMDAAVPTIGKMAAQTGSLARAWDSAANALSDYWDGQSKLNAQNVERLTGVDMGGFSDEDRLQRLKSQQATLQESHTPKLEAPQLKIVNEELTKLEQKLKDAAAASDDKRFGQFSMEQDAATRALIPEIEQIEKMTRALAEMARAKSVGDARSSSGRPATRQDQDNNDAAAKGRLVTADLIESQEIERNRVKLVSQIAVAYKGVSESTALILDRQKMELGVAQAVTEKERQIATEKLNTYNLSFKTVNAQEAAQIAAGETAKAQAQIGAEMQRSILTARDQLTVAKEWTAQGRLAAEEKATYNELVRKTANEEKSAQLASLERQTAQANIDSGAKRALATAQDQLVVARAFTGQQKMAAQEQATYNELIRQGVEPTTARNIAETQRAATQAQINNSIKEQTIGIEQQNELLRAQLGGLSQQEQARIAAGQAYANAIRAGADAVEAAALSSAVLEQGLLKAAIAAKQVEENLTKASEAELKSFANKIPAAGTSVPFGANINVSGGKGTYVIQNGMRLDPFGINAKIAMMEDLQKHNLSADDKFTALVNDTLGQGGNIQSVITKLETTKSGPSAFDKYQAKLFGVQLQDTGDPTTKYGQVGQLYDLLNKSADKATQKSNIQAELAYLQSEPVSLARETAIASLMSAIQDNTAATEKNTITLPSILSSLYKGGDQFGPQFGTKTSTSHFADGGIMTRSGAMPLNTYGFGRVVSSPQMFQAGEHYQPEAIIPLTNGAVPVIIRSQGSTGNNRPINATVNVFVQGNGGADPNSPQWRQAIANAGEQLAAVVSSASNR